MDGPIFLRHEGSDFHLAFDDQPERDGLHASRRKTAAHLIPEQRGNLITYDAVENSPGLLRVDQVYIDLPRMLERGANRLRRNFVERDPENLLRIRCWYLLAGRFLCRLFRRFALLRLLLEARGAGFLLRS